MKKYFIIAAAAVVAMAACSKVEDNFDLTSPSNKIAFEVANYAAQTKAPTSLATGEDALFSFNTTAVQFPEIGTPVTFMNEETIKAWDDNAEEVTASNVKTTTNTNGKEIYTWAPAVDYFWPKTGYINFYSYAGTKAPVVDVEASASPAQNAGDMRKVTFAYSNVTIDATDNILVADAALHFNSNNAAHYNKDHVTKGVPTLFRHQLAKIKFIVHLKTEQPASNNTTWQVRTIAEETISGTACKSYINYVNKGSLTLVNTDELAKTADMNETEQAWTAAPAGTVSGWVPSSAAADIDEVVLTTNTLTIPENETESDETDPAIMVAERTVMPQLTSGTKFVLYYEVKASHDDGSTWFMTEIRTVGVDASKTLEDLASTIDDWPKNTKITYNVIIDPVTEKVTFDPAVEEWETENNGDDININHTGII